MTANPRAFEAAAARCRQATPGYTTTLSPTCQQVAHTAVALRSQYALGAEAVNTATMDMRAAFARSGRMPAQLAAAASEPPTPIPVTFGAGASGGALAIGPMPGAITYTWTRGLLSGEKLVLAPAAPPASGTAPCWRVDAAATTVPIDIRLIGPALVDTCG